MFLIRLKADVAAFQLAAFVHQYPSLSARKQAMWKAAQSCSDECVRNVLAGSIDFIEHRATQVRRAISEAYESAEHSAALHLDRQNQIIAAPGGGLLGGAPGARIGE